VETEEAVVISLEELQLAARNHGMPLEALRYEITPVGLHYLLTHYDIPGVDASTWRLEVGGLVSDPMSLSLDDLRARPRVTLPVTMECAGNGRTRFDPRPVSQPWILEAVGTGSWTGTPLKPLLDEAGLRPEAVEVVFTGADRGVEGDVEQAYARSLSLEEALGDDVLLAYEVNGQPLPPQHGFPLRLVVPGWYGMTSVKWLTSIEAVAEPFLGYQMVKGYRRKATEGQEGEPITRIMPRSLMVPPGIPEFFSRSRVVPLGPVELQGRAWSGWAPIAKVEVSTDGGASWSPAELGDAPGRRAWRGWRFVWTPDAPGPYELVCRCADEAGHEQPLEGSWNVGGYENNAVQRVSVTVTA
jgi:DMSO/TMAO reductase YedYZ molybdopterin-dependent catalytic subunit